MDTLQYYNRGSNWYLKTDGERVIMFKSRKALIDFANSIEVRIVPRPQGMCFELEQALGRTVHASQRKTIKG